ncbi:MAG: metal ABC transporter permease [Proteobacteria bacterium]|nr:metal ABC transporter permease [Pseudomonadota bacterium]
MFAYDFMINAFIAGGIVAVMAAIVGFFLVMREQTFAGHALSHIGFAGATGSVLLGASPMSGMILITLCGGATIGALGEKVSGRDVAIGMVLSIALGFGILFLHFYTAYATQINTLLFGNILGVSYSMLWTLASLAIISLTLLSIVSRPLIFVSLQPELAEAKGVSSKFMGIIFLTIVAFATSGCIQIVGVLFVFTLMIGPAAAAQQISTRLLSGISLAVLFALSETWGGLALSYLTNWPSSFWIATLSGSVYLISLTTKYFLNHK